MADNGAYTRRGSQRSDEELRRSVRRGNGFPSFLLWPPRPMRTATTMTTAILLDNDDDGSLQRALALLAEPKLRLSRALIPTSLGNYYLQPEIDYGSHYVWLYLTPAIFVSL